MPAGHRGPRNNPWAAAAEEQVGELPEPAETEDSGENEAPEGADPSGGLASSSRSAAPGEDLQVISFGSDEDAAHGDPSKRTVEEEGESSGRGGRREPRTKASHDKDAAVARSAPREEAGAPPEGARASSPQPPKTKKRVWRMADE